MSNNIENSNMSSGNGKSDATSKVQGQVDEVVGIMQGGKKLIIVFQGF